MRNQVNLLTFLVTWVWKDVSAFEDRTVMAGSFLPSRIMFIDVSLPAFNPFKSEQKLNWKFCEYREKTIEKSDTAWRSFQQFVLKGCWHISEKQRDTHKLMRKNRIQRCSLLSLRLWLWQPYIVEYELALSTLLHVFHCGYVWVFYWRRWHNEFSKCDYNRLEQSRSLGNASPRFVILFTSNNGSLSHTQCQWKNRIKLLIFSRGYATV